MKRHRRSLYFNYNFEVKEEVSFLNIVILVKISYFHISIKTLVYKSSFTEIQYFSDIFFGRLFPDTLNSF